MLASAVRKLYTLSAVAVALLLTQPTETEASQRLPSVAVPGEALQHGAGWWAKVNDRIYHAPSSDSGLSSSVSDYYYAVGAHSGLSEELQERRVGGAGRVHLFHLPGGPGALKTPVQPGSRRSSVSVLTQLKHGVVLSDAFPSYQYSATYINPLGAAGQSTERTVVGQLTENLLMAELTNLTSLPNPESPTRSHSNPSASQAAINFLQDQFKSMGLTTCLQSFTRAGEQLVNVVGYLAGTGGAETVTVGAHYDSRPFEGAAPGAVDNGSGVASMLSMARAVTNAKVKPVKNVYFVAFAAEEPGLWGSQSFVEQLTSGGLPPQCRAPGTAAAFPVSLAMNNRWGFFRGSRNSAQAALHKALIMDEVAWRSPRYPTPTVNLESYDWASDVLENLAQASKTHNTGNNHLDVVHSSNPFGSDHISFLSKGVHGVLSIHADDNAYPDYHSSSDSMKNVNATLLTQITRMNLGALLRLAGIAQ